MFYVAGEAYSDVVCRLSGERVEEPLEAYYFIAPFLLLGLVFADVCWWGVDAVVSMGWVGVTVRARLYAFVFFE